MLVIRAWLISANLLTHPTDVVIVLKSTHACRYSWENDVIISAYFHFSYSDLVRGGRGETGLALVSMSQTGFRINSRKINMRKPMTHSTET